MSLVQYTLPSHNTASGLLKTYLFVDSILPALMVPTNPFILNLGTFEEEERIDVNPTEIDIENVSVDIAEDYSVYPEGFWNKVINGYPNKTVQTSCTFSEPQYPSSSPAFSNTIVRSDGGSFIADGWYAGLTGTIDQTGANNGFGFTVTSLTASTLTIVEHLSVVSATAGTLTSPLIDCDVQVMFTSMNGSNEEYFFRGRVYREGTTCPTYYRSGTSKVCGVKIQLLSMLSAIDAVLTSALTIDSVAYQYDSEINTYYVKFSDLIASLLGAVFHIPATGASITNAAKNFMFSHVNSADPYFPTPPNWYQWTDCYFIAENDDYPATGLLNIQDPLAWANRYATAKNLLSHLCLEFGCVPMYSFGNSSGYIEGSDPTNANNKHRIVFKARDFGGDTVTMDGGILEEDFLSASTMKANSFRFTLAQNEQNTVCQFNDAMYFNNQNVPSNAQFEVDEEVDFATYEYTAILASGGRVNYLYLGTFPGGTFEPIEVRFIGQAVVVPGLGTTTVLPIQSVGFFSQTTNQIQRPSGSFIADGWRVGMTGCLKQYGDNTNSGKTFKVLSVTDTAITTQQIFNTQGNGTCTLTQNANLYEMCLNYYRMIFSTNRFQYTRTYSSIKSTTDGVSSQMNTKLLQNHIIQDVVNGATVSITYYATSIKKDILKNTVEIIWVKL